MRNRTVRHVAAVACFVVLTQLARSAEALPDLIVSSASTSDFDSQVHGGSTIFEVYHTTSNEGDATSVSFWCDSVYLSTDTVLGGGDIELATFSHSGAVSAGGGYNSIMPDIAIPSVAAGNYYLILWTDSSCPMTGTHVIESDETNNTTAIPIYIGGPADLVVTSFNAPSSISTWDTVVITYTADNLGPDAALWPWSDHFFISNDATLDAGDVNHSGPTNTTSVAAGSSYNRTYNLGGVAPVGNYYLILKLNAAVNGVVETDTTNNTYTVPITVTQPDLAPTAINPSAPLYSGQMASISWTVANQGNGAIGTGPLWRDRLYLSVDNVYDAGDSLLGLRLPSGPLAVSGTYDRSLDVTLPGVTPGTYYLIVRVDSSNDITGETSESNNDLSLEVMVEAPPATATPTLTPTHTPTATPSNTPTFTPTRTPTEINSCCVGNAGLGCETSSCESCVCTNDPYCCTNQWDEICARQTAGACAANCGCAAPSVCPSGSSDPSDCRDDLVCYKAATTKDTAKFLAVENFRIEFGIFGTHIDVKKPKDICAPAFAPGGAHIDATTHYEAYQVKPLGSKFDHALQMTDEFGTWNLQTGKPVLLFVPSNKGLGSTPAAPTAGVADMYGCWSAKLTSGSFPKDVQATRSDQFESARLYDVKKLKYVCRPVHAIAERYVNPVPYQTCYQIKVAKEQPKHVPIIGQIHTANRFGNERINTKKQELMCVPAVRIDTGVP